MPDISENSERNLPARTVWVLTIGAFLAFFIFGFVDNLKGPILPILLRDLDFSYSTGGTLLLGAYLGFLIATLLTGALADTVGNKALLIAAGLLLTAGVLMFSLSATFWPLAAAMLLIGLGMGAIEVGGNSLIVEVHDERRGQFLNLLGVFHGTGSLLVPLVAAYLLARNMSWQQIYQLTLVLTVLLTLYFLFVRYPRPGNGESHGFDLALLRSKGFTRRMNLYYLLIAVYVAAEIGIASWIVEFLQVEKGMAQTQSALYLSLFFLFIMLGRLGGSFVVERVGYLRIILAASLFSIVFLAIGIYGHDSLAIFIPLTGFFFSIVFPTATASVSHQHAQNTGAILGLLFAFGGLGGAFGPWLMGVASDMVGIQQGFALSILYCVVMAVAALILRRMGGTLRGTT